jgi:hypothetical protein
MLAAGQDKTDEGSRGRHGKETCNFEIFIFFSYNMFSPMVCASKGFLFDPLKIHQFFVVFSILNGIN